MTERDRAMAALRKHLPDLDAAAIPTKCEVFALCGNQAREMYNAILTLTRAEGQPELSERDLREQVARMRGLVLKFEDFLNIPPTVVGDESCQLRDYRHAAFREWEPMCAAVLSILPALTTNTRPEGPQTAPEPVGWKLVPVEPTREMRSRGLMAICDTFSVNPGDGLDFTGTDLAAWRAMVAAAPYPLDQATVSEEQLASRSQPLSDAGRGAATNTVNTGEKA